MAGVYLSREDAHKLQQGIEPIGSILSSESSSNPVEEDTNLRPGKCTWAVLFNSFQLELQPWAHSKLVLRMVDGQLICINECCTEVLHWRSMAKS